MNKFFIFFYTTFLFVSFLASEENVRLLTFNFLEKLSSENLKELKKGQKVEIRGFIYETPDGQTILSANPHLKSCCAGSLSKRNQQILIIGDLTNGVNQKSTAFIRGDFFVDLEKPFPFRLENAVIVKENKQLYTFSLLTGGALLGAGLFFYFRRQKKLN